AALEGLGEAHVEGNLAQTHAARTRVLDHDELLDALVRLQADDELVCEDRSRPFSEDGMRDRLELDDDLGDAGGQPLAGSEIEGHARPAPVLDLGTDGNEGFGAALAAQLLDIAFHRAAGGSSGAV